MTVIDTVAAERQTFESRNRFEAGSSKNEPAPLFLNFCRQAPVFKRNFYFRFRLNILCNNFSRKQGFNA